MRYQQYMRQRYSVLSAYLGSLLIIIAGVIASPLILLPFFPQEIDYAPAFIMTALPTGLIGWLLRRRVNFRETASPTLQEGMVAIVIAWTLAIFIGALPFYFIKDLTFSQAVFESTSGWTTTGLTMVDVSIAPHLVLFYRSALQLVGGAGFAIIMLSSITGPSGSGLSAAEGRDDQLAPHVRQSASIVLRLYLFYVVAGIIALMFAGMNWFDAINHAFTAVATGGFSTRVESIGYYNSALIEAIIIVLMILGMINFLTVFVLLRGKTEAFLRNGEIRVLAVLMPVGVLLLLFGTTIPLYSSLEYSLRVALFEFVSAMSTTGVTIVPDFYASWNQFGWLVLTIAMLVGGSSGSTAGGIKLFRIYVLFKALRWEIRKAFLPDHAVNQAVIWKGDQRTTLNDGQIRRTALFTFVYMLIFFLIVALMLTQGDYTVGEALFETASTISGVGISVGITHPGVPDAQLWIQSFGMLLGRLEFFAFLIGIIKLGRDSMTLFRSVEH